MSLQLKHEAHPVLKTKVTEVCTQNQLNSNPVVPGQQLGYITAPSFVGA